MNTSVILPEYAPFVPYPRGESSVLFVGGWSTHRHVGDDAILRVHLDRLQELDLPLEPVILGPDPDALESRFGARSCVGLDRFMWRPESAEEEWPRPGTDLSAAQRFATISDLRTGGLTALAHPDVHRLASELERASALIVLGAGSLSSKFARSLWTQAATAELARAGGTPVAVAGATLGPVNSALDAIVLRRLLDAAELVSARDRIHSPVVARKLGVEHVLTEWDPAARMTPAPEVGLGGNAGAPSDGYAVFATWPVSFSEQAVAIDALHSELGLSTIGIPMDFFPGRPDTDALAEMRAQLRHPEAFRIIEPVPPDSGLVALIAGARVAFGSRYHLAVFAAAHGTPAVLSHFDSYSRRRAEGLAELAGSSVCVFDGADGGAALAETVLQHANSPRRSPIPPPSLPAIEWLADRLRDSVRPELLGSAVASGQAAPQPARGQTRPSRSRPAHAG